MAGTLLSDLSADAVGWFVPMAEATAGSVTGTGGDSATRATPGQPVSVHAHASGRMLMGRAALSKASTCTQVPSNDSGTPAHSHVCWDRGRPTVHVSDRTGT